MREERNAVNDGVCSNSKRFAVVFFILTSAVLTLRNSINPCLLRPDVHPSNKKNSTLVESILIARNDHFLEENSAPEAKSYHSNFDRVFEASRTTTENKDEPPKEHTWFLPPFNQTSSKSQKIPRLINKIYFQNDGQFPHPSEISDNLLSAHKSWQDNNPGYQIRYFNLTSARSYLRQHYHPTFLRTFDCIQAFSGKSNFFRAALLYREGGWHSDWKQKCLKDNLLDELSLGGREFFAARDKGTRTECVQTAFVGAIPQHPIIAKYLEVQMVHVQSRFYGDHSLETTGPCAFGKAFFKYDEEVRKRKGKGRDDEDGDGIGSIDELTSEGKYENQKFHWRDEKIVLHKCKSCGSGQKWDKGNDYNKLWKNQDYYCEDAPSIFSNE